MKRTTNNRTRHMSAHARTTLTRFRALAVATVLALVAALLPLGLLAPAQGAVVPVVGQGFVVTPADLAFILKQIQIAENHAASATPADPCAGLLGTGPNQIESPLLSLGLRTVDGTCNNLQPGQETFGAADMTFPRLTTPEFNDAENATEFGGSATSSYAQTSGAVADSEPRTVSNLIVDQTSTNPAAVAAAQFPIRSQGNEGVVPCTTEPSTPGGTDGLPVGCVPAHETLDIPNVTTDVGLSPPFNSLFTIFGQFFDHGLDKITNGGSGNVFVPLKADDPLIAGPDHISGNSDDLPASQRFMVLSRGTNVPGAGGVRNAPNTDTPFVDQSQTYTSHASHQVFLREYVNNTSSRPVATGKFLSTPDGGLATWAQIKTQARVLLGLELVDADVNDIPMIATDPYGKFIPGPVNGLPQFVTVGGMVEGNRANPVTVPADAVRIGTAFLNDIAHSAGPGSIANPKSPDANSTAGGSLDPQASGQYDDELLGIHAICGDGRCNENIALQAVHQVFHNEHDRLIGDIMKTITEDNSGQTHFLDWRSVDGANGWNGERLFQAARFVTEMEYQHLVFEEFARKVQPGINPFEPFAFGQTDINPAITAEFAHAVYRFGHSMLTDTIPRLNADGSRNDIDLFDGFLNPGAYHDGGSAGTLTSAEAAGAIIMGLSDQAGQEIDEFVSETLRNRLLGLPLDLPALNMARARSEGIPPLNEVRRQVHAATNDGAMKPYTDWVDFGQQLKHPESLINFVAAYGTHPTITGTLAERRAAARTIVNPEIGEVQPADSGDFMFGTNYDETADNTPAVPSVDAGPGPDGVLGDAAPTVAATCTAPNVPAGCDESLDDTPAVDAVPAGPGPDTVLGDASPTGPVTCTGPNVPVNCDESLDDTPAVDPEPAGPGPDTVLGDVPPTGPVTCTGPDVPVNCDESLDDTPAVPAVPEGPGPDTVLGDAAPTVAAACTSLNVPAGCDESLDDTAAVPAVPEGPGPDGILNATNDPATNWANAGGRTVTGVDAIDLWVGGLAERTNLFGGLLGSTFNYVFEKQLTDLQNGDRFYYLARTPGMNLRAQLEGNSFSELVMRNTNARNLKADPFGTADCKFDLETITWPGKTVGSSGILIKGAGSVQDDPTSECDENEHLLRMSDGTIRYRMTNTAMPSGINAQAVYDGKRDTTGPVKDRIWGGADNDTFWGRAGNDVIEGGDGADVALGGEGNDIITDLAGDDVPKGGPGNDAIDGGPGLDILMGGEGKDFMNGGANSNETFGGPGDDFVIAGEGMDAVFGDSGDDWQEGGDQPDLLIGDSSSFFFDDHNVPGHDILIGQGGDDDYDHEGGDDIGVAGPGVEKTAGAAGFDWQIGLGDPQAQNMDLAQVFVAGGVVPPGVRDKFNEVEALSGWNLNDTLRGDDIVPTEVGGGGFVGCDALDAAGVDRIGGLVALVPAALRTVPAADLIAASASQNCGISGNVWGAGNILLGGSGSDLLEGRGADDIIDGDRYLNVRLSVRLNPANADTQIGTTDRMAGLPKSGTFGDGTAGMTLSQAVFAGLVNPGNIVAVREILTPPSGTDVDVAVFAGALAEYVITANANGSVTVDHQGGADGVDTLWNVEQLQFAGGTIPAPVFGALAPTAVVSPPGGGPLVFGDQAVGVASVAQVITVANGGTAPLDVTGVTVTGTGSTSYTPTDVDCLAVNIAVGASCTINVVFTPITLGAKVAQVNILHNAAGSPSIVSLDGTGVDTPPVLTMAGNTSATAIAFGTRRIGTVRTQNVLVTNNGPGVLLVTDVQEPAGPFTATRGTCTANVPVGGTCRLSVTFTPNGPARVVITELTVISNAVAADEVLWVTGTSR